MSESDVLTHDEAATLAALVETGPLAVEAVPSWSGRESLLRRGLAVKIVVKGQEGYHAATYRGADMYRKYFGGDTIAQATEHRTASSDSVS